MKKDQYSYGVVLGDLLGLCAGIVLVSLFAGLICNNVISEVHTELLITVTLFIQGILAGVIAGKRCRQHLFAVVAITTISQPIILFVLGLLFEGVYTGVVRAAAAIICGGLVSYLICLKATTKKRKRKSRYR